MAFRVFEDKSHVQNIVQMLWLQCENGNGEFCDVVLIAGSEELRIPAHRSLLSAQSQYFKDMFSSSDSASREIILPDVDGNILKLFIRYMYTGSLELKLEIVEKLILTAHMLGLDEVVNACCKFIAKNLHPTNCLEFALLADQYDLTTLSKQAKDYCWAYFMDVCKTDKFLNLNAEQLAELLASEYIAVSTEEDVFNALMSWVQHDKVERLNNKDELLKLVNLAHLNKSFLSEYVKPVCTSVECLQLYTEAMKQNNTNLSTNSRRSYQFLMGISRSDDRSGIHLHYFNQTENEWMKWLQDLEYRLGFEVAVIQDNVYIAGGFDAAGDFLNTVICLNLSTMSMKEVSPMKEQRAVFGLAALNGALYALGGWTGHYMNSVEKWDPLTNEWNVVAPMSSNRSNFSVAVLNERLYIVGGVSDSDNTMNSVEYYDPNTNIWKTIAPMNERRTQLGVVVANNLLYAVGGLQTKTVECYDPQANRWTKIRSLHDNLVSSRSCIALRNKLIVCYGDRVEEYDVPSNEWKVNSVLKGLANIYCIFAYSHKLQVSEYAAEN